MARKNSTPKKLYVVWDTAGADTVFFWNKREAKEFVENGDEKVYEYTRSPLQPKKVK